MGERIFKTLRPGESPFAPPQATTDPTAPSVDEVYALLGQQYATAAKLRLLIRQLHTEKTELIAKNEFLQAKLVEAQQAETGDAETNGQAAEQN